MNFKVLYVGKMKLPHQKVPESFIDDALVKFRAHGLDKSKSTAVFSNLLQECQQHRVQSNPTSSSDARRGSAVAILSFVTKFSCHAKFNDENCFVLFVCLFIYLTGFYDEWFGQHGQRYSRVTHESSWCCDGTRWFRWIIATDER